MTEKKKIHFNKKTVATIVFALMTLGLIKFCGTKDSGKVATQVPVPENISGKKPANDNADTVTVDSVHAVPMVNFSGVPQSIYMEMEGFTFVAPGFSKLVWSPLVVLKPNVTFNDKLVLGLTTTQMAQTYTGDNMSMMLHNIFFNATFKTKNGSNIFANVGKMQTLNYCGQYAKYMPISLYFENAMIGGSGHTVSSMAQVGFNNKHGSVALGYGENNSQPFTFNGGGDWFVVGEVFLNKVKIGTLWAIDPECRVTGDVQVAYNAGQQSGLLEMTKIGTDNPYLHGLYAIQLNNDATAFVNAWGQIDGGMAGGNVGIKHNPSGIYGSFGFANQEHLLQGTSQYGQLTPILEIGIAKGFVPKSR